MATRLSSPGVRIGHHPVHAFLGHVPFVCFAAALVTDLAYAGTASMQWATFSVWLITGGLVAGALAILAGIVGAIVGRSVPRERTPWLRGFGTIVSLVLAFVNVLVHSRDAWTAVVPTGLTLSIVIVVILAISNWWGAETTPARTTGAFR